MAQAEENEPRGGYGREQSHRWNDERAISGRKKSPRGARPMGRSESSRIRVRILERATGFAASRFGVAPTLRLVASLPNLRGRLAHSRRRPGGSCRAAGRKLRTLASVLARANVRFASHPVVRPQDNKKPGVQRCARTPGILVFWSGLRGSNPRPRAWEASALPTELNPLGSQKAIPGN